MKFKILSQEDRESVKMYIDKLPPDKLYNVEIVRKQPRRSIDQNKLYWLWLNCISKEIGYPPDELHSVFALKYLGASHRVICGETVVATPSTKRLSTEEFSAYLDQVSAFVAAELGIILPDPQDRYFEQFYEQYKGII